MTYSTFRAVVDSRRRPTLAYAQDLGHQTAADIAAHIDGLPKIAGHAFGGFVDESHLRVFSTFADLARWAYRIGAQCDRAMFITDDSHWII